MPGIPERTPTDFADILCGPELPLIVGGQAVNLWAELYSSELTNLDDYRPFVSKDADIYGTRALAESMFVAAVNYTAEVVMAGWAGNAARSYGLDLRSVFPASVWLNGPAALQPILERLRAHGLGP